MKQSKACSSGKAFFKYSLAEACEEMMHYVSMATTLWLHTSQVNRYPRVDCWSVMSQEV